jgi:hypothetical protein
MGQFTRQMTVAEFEALFPDDDACKAYLVRRRWPEGVRCPRCGNQTVYPVTNRPFHWQCTRCAKAGGYRFSVLVGTIFENTNVPLRTWFRVIHLMLTSKKGISALQVQRMMGFGSYHTAHYMCHRIRAGLSDPGFRKLMGIVEVDETYVAGKNKNRHWDKKPPGTGSTNKLIVAGAVERKGSVVARVIERTDTDTMDAFVDEAVSNKVSLVGHGRARRLSPAGQAVSARLRGPPARAVRERRGPHPDHRRLLVALEARHCGHVPQGEQGTPAALRRRVRVPPQPPEQPRHLRQRRSAVLRRRPAGRRRRSREEATK